MTKDKSLLVHTISPFNAEPPLNKLREHFITPVELFYARNHGGIPVIDGSSYRLRVNGMVSRELEFSIHQLQHDFPKHTVMATLQCAGNRRDQLIAVAPVPNEVPWQSGAIGNTTWSGVRLNDILLAAGIKEPAKYAAFTGADDVFRNGENVGFGGSVPIDKAMHDEVLLAYEMNGKILEQDHGFPLRVVVPGYIGARSVKWVTQITLQEEPSKNYFQDHAYRLFSPQTNAQNVNWDSGLQLGELSVNCVITSPENDSLLPGNQLLVTGYAMSGGGRAISRVDISADDGETWATARITESHKEPWAWVFWEANVELENGSHEIVARAIDAAANTQPSDPRQVWNFKGYMNNAWHRVKVHVKINQMVS